METQVTISKKLYSQLLQDQQFLQCLENAGVDNWQGYSDACEEYRSDRGCEEDDDPLVLPDIEAEGERIVADTYQAPNRMYHWTDVVGAVQTAIDEERRRHFDSHSNG